MIAATLRALAPAVVPPGDELCQRVAQALAATKASYDRRRMADVAAASQRRQPGIVTAMENAPLEPVISEDLFQIGEDLGRAAGRARGEGRALLRVCQRRGLALSERRGAHVQRRGELATLEARLDRAIQATTSDERMCRP